MFYGILESQEYHFQFEKESRAAKTKSHPVKASWGSNRSAKRALLKSATAGNTTGRARYGYRQWVRNYRPQEREKSTIRARAEEGLPGFGGPPKGNPTITCQKRAWASSARSTARGEERWYVKYHRPRNRLRALRRSAMCKAPPAEGTQGASP